MSFDPVEYHFNSVNLALASLRQDVEKERAKAREMVEAAALGAVGFRPTRRWPLDDYDLDVNRYHGPSQMIDRIGHVVAECEKLKADNEAANEHNAAVVKAALEFCKRLGLPETEIVQKRGRGKREVATWRTAIQATLPPPVVWSVVEEWKRRGEHAAKAWQERLDAERRAREEELQRKAQERREEEARVQRAVEAGLARERRELENEKRRREEEERLRSMVRGGPAPAVVVPVTESAPPAPPPVLDRFEKVMIDGPEKTTPGG